jgi:LCP family protein required for cell wall assembly
MTDREDGTPSRGPRRYGPSAGQAPGAPRTGDRPVGPPRRRSEDANSPTGARAWSAADAGRPVGPLPARYGHPGARAASPQAPAPAPRLPATPPRPSGVGSGSPVPPAAHDRSTPGSGPAERESQLDRWRRRLWLGRLLAAVLSVITLVASGFVAILSDTTGQQAAGIISDCAGGVTCSGTTILLVGSDARVDAEGNPLTEEELRAVATEADGGGTSTDTMMIIHIPAGGGRATAVSIPRDSWIANPPAGPSDSGADPVPYRPNKVNSFYGSAKAYTAERLVAEGVDDAATRERESSDAGRKMLISVVEELTGAHIDHYAEINLFGFYLLSNAIGGVPVCLIAPVNDPMSGAVFDAGQQEVQGTAALSFVRQRHGLPNGDLDRVKRQQAFLSGAISKVLSIGTLSNPSTLRSLVEAANRSIVLSEGFNLLALAEQMSAISAGNINFQTLPTHGPEPTTSADALHIDVSEIRRLFAGIVSESATSDGSSAAGSDAAPASSVDRSAVTVDVQNATVTSGLAAGTSEGLSALGWGAGDVSQYPGTSADDQRATTTIFHADGDEAAAELMRSDLGFGEPAIDDALSAGQLRVVVGLDAPDAAGLRSAGPAFAGTAPLLVRSAADEPINAAAPGCVN